MEKKKIKKEEIDLDEIGMKGLFPENMKTTEIIEKVRREWARKLVYGSA